MIQLDSGQRKCIFLPETDCFVLHCAEHRNKLLPNSYRLEVGLTSRDVVATCKWRGLWNRRTAMFMFHHQIKISVFIHQCGTCFMPALYNAVWSCLSSAPASAETACLPACRLWLRPDKEFDPQGWMEGKREGMGNQNREEIEKREKRQMGWKRKTEEIWRYEWRRGEERKWEIAGGRRGRYERRGNKRRKGGKEGLKWPHWQAVPRFQDRCASEPSECDVSY